MFASKYFKGTGEDKADMFTSAGIAIVLVLFGIMVLFWMIQSTGKHIGNSENTKKCASILALNGIRYSAIKYVKETDDSPTHYNLTVYEYRVTNYNDTKINRMIADAIVKVEFAPDYQTSDEGIYSVDTAP